MYLNYLSIINYMLTTLNFSYNFQLMPFQKIFYSCKILYPTFLHGWPQTFYHSTLLKLTFSSLVFLHNLQKSTIPYLQFLLIQQYSLFLLLEILVLSLILIFLFLIISSTCQNLFGMLYHTIFALIFILSKPILFSHYLLHNFISNWKLTFFFIHILLSPSLYWTNPLELWSSLFMWFVFHFISFILDPFICSTRFNLLFVI